MTSQKRASSDGSSTSSPRISVRVDHGRCIASGRCVRVLPEVFFQTEEGFASAKERPAPQCYERVRSAADECPASAIIIGEE